MLRHQTVTSVSHAVLNVDQCVTCEDLLANTAGLNHKHRPNDHCATVFACVVRHVLSRA